MDEIGRKYALKEWRLLQETIRQQVDLVFKIRNWMILFLTGLTAGLFYKKVHLEISLYIAFSMVIIFVFLTIELSQRVIQKRARGRCRIVEKALRENSHYSGPCIADCMTTTYFNPITHIRNCFDELRTPPVYFPAGVILLSVILMVAIAIYKLPLQ